MARGPAFFTTFLFFLFLFTFSSARTTLDLPQIEDSNHNSFSESDKNSAAANAIFLPSDKADSDPATVAQWEHASTVSEISQPDAATAESTEVLTESSEVPDPIPFTVISFRPINRRVPRHPLPLSFRLGHRCRHNNRFKPWNPRLPRREIPYGNDMILNNVEDRSFDQLPRDAVRQIPARWMRFHHLEPRFPRETGMEREELMRPHPHNNRHEHHHHHEQDLEIEELTRPFHPDHHHEHHEQEHEDSGLMKKIRKFLHHF